MPFPYNDLREFIADLEKEGELIRIKTPVSHDLEITEITDRVSKEKGAANKALLFENVIGHTIPVVTNLMGSNKRMCMALGVNDLDEIGDRIRETVNPMNLFPPSASLMEKIGNLPKLAELASVFPKVVTKAPCQEMVITGDMLDLTKLPVLKCWPDDGGPFITLPMVCSTDPITGATNVGMYRIQIYDAKTTGMHWHKHKDGAKQYNIRSDRGEKKMEVAIAIGADPATIFSASAPLPPIVGEFMFSGFLRKKHLEVVQCKTVDVKVPAHAEIVLEGYVELGEMRTEGPFGDHTGYYSLADEFPVFHCTAITMRKDPIYPATIVGRPPQEDAYMGKATERIFLPLLQMVAPEVLDYDMPVEGGFHNMVIVKIKKLYPGHARKVMNTIWGTGLLMLTKTIVVVDDDVNIHDYHEVMWKVLNHIDPKRDLVFMEGPLDNLDHAAPLLAYGSKVGIDATKKIPGEGFTREWPDEIIMSDDIKNLVDKKWKEYGF